MPYIFLLLRWCKTVGICCCLASCRLLTHTQEQFWQWFCSLMSEREWGFSLDMRGWKRMGPKSNLNNISGCRLRSILDLCYPQPRHAWVYLWDVRSGIDHSGPQTMCAPQGVARGRFEQTQRGPALECHHQPVPPSPSDESKSPGWRSCGANTGTQSSTHARQHMAARRSEEAGSAQAFPGVANGIAVFAGFAAVWSCYLMMHDCSPLLAFNSLRIQRLISHHFQ